ncbi:MAG: hypothetical protein P4M11_05365 [Candidatus Pacebacteria bacterium]|nr:hypothetical protein [Candidatus Paceibacterota bacterium]
MPRTRQKTQKETKKKPETQNLFLPVMFVLLLGVFGAVVYTVEFSGLFSVQYSRADNSATTTGAASVASAPPVPTLNKVAYDQKLLSIANLPPQKVSSTSSSTPVSRSLWPVKTAYPEAGALLPFNRIVAYYGNFYSTKMGVLGATPPQQMLQQLMATVQEWHEADPSTPVMPGIDYIAVTAQGSPGADGKYRLRMPSSQIDEAVSLANQVHGIVILDIQVGLSNVQTEVPLLAPYLKQSNVELALDPEFSMKDGAPPGTEIGTLDASDINWAAQYLAQLVNDNNLPPKVLVVHRFTQNMVTRSQYIEPLPQVQIVMDMDGWGSQPKKINTYRQFIASQPVQFTGFKLFYINDLRAPSTGMLTPAQVLNLSPQPLFIQYQ